MKWVSAIVVHEHEAYARYPTAYECKHEKEHGSVQVFRPEVPLGGARMQPQMSLFSLQTLDAGPPEEIETTVIACNQNLTSCSFMDMYGGRIAGTGHTQKLEQTIGNVKHIAVFIVKLCSTD